MKLILTFLGALILITASVFFIMKNRISKQAFPSPTQAITQSSTTTNIQTKTYTISSGSVPNIPLQLPSGYTIHVFASGLGKPRDLQFSPGGTLLVSDPAQGQVFALPDKNHNGVADSKKIIIGGKHAHGLAFYGGKLFTANVTSVDRYNWDENNLQANFEKELFPLPDNTDHNNRTITFNQSGNMYVSVGSTCNVCHEASNESATVMISNANGDNPHVFANGLRNAAFITVNPQTNELWGTEMGRDYLGDNLPPDEINIIRNGKDYGWPYCYGNQVHDNNFDPAQSHSCSNTLSPVFQIPAHSAPLGLAFIHSSQFPTDEQNDLLVAYHGSWNRSSPIGYKVVHLKVNGNSITNSEDFLTGFLPSTATNGPDGSLGRPVDMTFDSEGNLYISDDKAGNVYIVQKSL